MNEKELKKIISKGEGIDIEFKESRNALNKDVFETVCAFLNRKGGHLILGVKDNGKIIGVENPQKLINDFITLANNPQKLNPTFYFSPEIFQINGKNIIYIFIPESSQVHKTAGKIFDRNRDGDLDITNNSSLVTALYIRKQTTYSENTIFPYADISDFRKDLLQKVRIMAKNERGDNHPWLLMTDEEFFKSTRLYQKNLKTGEEGFTLAAILLFGKDDTILSALPHHRTDAILRIKNKDRYDDRDDIRTNLIESYDRLMDFVKKHLPDPFYQEEDKRISLRNKIFRETVVNILIHREFINPYPAKMIIEENFVLFENASKPHGFGKLTPESFSPFPKNPNIAKIFREIGLAEEMGSGVRNLFKYSKIYSGFEPEIEEGDIFKVVIRVPIKKENIPQVPPQDTPQAEELSKREIAILDFCKIPRSADKIGKFINIKDRKHLRNSILKPLLEKKLLKLTIPDKPNSPKQKYLYEGKAFITPHTSPQVSPQATPQATPQDTPQAEKLSEREMAILDFCKIPRSADEIGKFINIKDRKHLRNSILKPLLEKKLLKLTIPDKPNSPKQKYLSALKEIKNNE